MRLNYKNFKKVIATFIAILISTSIFTNLPINTEIARASDYASLDSQAYSGNDLGATYTTTKTSFKVWAPTASDVKVKLYKTGSDSEAGAGVISTTAMTKGSQGVWSVEIQGDIKNTYYTYLVNVNGTTNETVDIYAYSGGVNGNRGMVVDMDSTDPVGWQNDNRVTAKNQTDAIVWEGHVRDFSIAANSGISDANKGKFLAFTEKGTTVNNDGINKTGIDYLKNLGVTHVQLLPVYDYSTVDETRLSTSQFNWGYDPKNYNMPEGSYSTNPYDGNSRVKEFKQMVQSLHNENIGVIMDVVYNHTFEGVNKDNASWFNLTVPGYYYRQTATGAFANGSGCGNETASDRAMYQKYMIDSLVHWATEYHLDGFRFDLMGLHDVDTMNKIREALNKVDPNIIIYGEPWHAGSTASTKPTAIQSNMYLVDSEVGAFNDKIRDAIKGSCFNKLDKGFVQGAAGFEERIKAGVQANSTTMAGTSKWSKQPSQTLTYTSAHDNYTLYDKLVTSTGKSGYQNRYDDVVAMNKLSAAIVLTSQGISFMQAGEEFARTKNGDENSYASSTDVNKLDWERTKNYSDLVSYYKGLIEIRKSYTPFRDPSNTTNNTIYFSWGASCPANVVAFTMQNKLTADTEWNYVGVIYNANDTSKTITLQGYSSLPSEWVVIGNGQKTGIESLGTTGSTITVPARSAMIVVDKASFDAHPVGKTGTVVVKHIDSATGSEIATSETKTGKVGTSYSTSASSIAGYILSKTPSNATGSFIEGTTTVTYEYIKDTTPKGTVTVKYIDKATNQEIATAKTLTGNVGTTYQTSGQTISGYDLDTTTLPSNITGTFTEGNQVVTYSYIKKVVKNLIVHYYNPNWTTVNLYTYDESTGTTKLLTGVWPGTKMTSEGYGWWKYEVTTATEGQVIFSNGTTQEPAAKLPGYKALGEVWIKDAVVLNEDPRIVNGKVTVKYIDIESNTEIAPSKVLTGQVGTLYNTAPLSITGYINVSPVVVNTSGIFTKEDITVVYTYVKVNVLAINKFDTNVLSPQLLGATILLNTDASGGTGELQTRFTVFDGVSWIIIKGYSTVTSTSWIPTKAGNYTVWADVKDATGKKVSKSISYIIKDPNTPLTMSSFTAGVASPQTIGNTITINAISSGGTGTLQTRFTVFDGASWVIIKGYSTVTSTSWTPTKAGNYTVWADVKDDLGKVVTKSMTYQVIDNNGLTINLLSANISSPQNVGTSIIFKTAASGGTGMLQSNFTVFDGITLTTIKDYTTQGYAIWKPTKAGTYTILVKVKDATGVVVTKSISYIIK